MMIVRTCCFAIAMVGAAPGLAQPEGQGEATDRNEIVVTATRTPHLLLETPAAVSVKDMDELENRGFTAGLDEFRGEPGIFFRRGEGDNDEFVFVNVRGVTGNVGNDGLLALVDGIPLIGPDEEVVVKDVPYGAVERIEIVRGPVSALYGRGATLGAVNYVTRSPRRNETEFRLGFGTAGYGRGEATVQRLIGDELRVLADFTHERQKGWRDNNERRSTNILAKVEADLASTTLLTGWMNWVDRFSKNGSALPLFPDGRIEDRTVGGREGFLGVTPAYDDRQILMGAVRLSHAPSDKVRLSLTGYARSTDIDYRANFYNQFGFNPAARRIRIAQFGSRGNAKTYFAEATVDWTLGKHRIVAGLNAESTDFDEVERWTGQNGLNPLCGFTFYATFIDYTTGAVLNGNHPCWTVDRVEADVTTENRFWSGFLQDEVDLGGGWTLTLGARYDAFRRTALFRPVPARPSTVGLSDEANHLSPKATLSFDFGDGLIYAAYGQGFNSNFGGIFEWNPTQYQRETRPLTSDSYELGLRGRALGGRLTYRGAAFLIRQKNRLLVINNPDFTGPPNLVTTGQLYESQGLESSLTFAPVRNLELTVNYTYLDPVWKELVVNAFPAPVDLSGRIPTGVPTHLFSAQAVKRFGRAAEIGASYERYGDYFVTLDNGVRGGAHQLVGLWGRYTLSKAPHVELTASVTNLFDQKYEYLFGGRSSAGSYTPGLPRQARIGLRTKF